ncbi:MAG: 30S ribosome-binding factor RbfA [Prolixibacteraceae bacterium]|nr:30S ribosome-binding factor RbfA [Prolixibacteraceae bacterium]
MESFSMRQNKVSRLIQKELAEVFLKELRSCFSGLLISVTVVRMTPDLSIARCYLSIYPPEKTEETMQTIEALQKNIRGAVGNRVAKQLRVVPEFEFYVDDSLDYIDKIDKLLK